MLTFLERTPEFEPLRRKFKLKLDNYFDSKLESPKPLKQVSGSSFASNLSHSPRSSVLVQMRNVFWLQLAKKYAFKGMTHMIETLTNKIDCTGWKDGPHMIIDILLLHFSVGVHVDLQMVSQLAAGCEYQKTQLMFVLFYHKSELQRRKTHEAHFILKKKPKTVGLSKNQSRKDPWGKQKTEKVDANAR